MHRFFVDPGAISSGRLHVAGPIAHQIRNVLRLRPGDQIIVLDNRGLEYEVELEIVSSVVEGTVSAERLAAGEPIRQVYLYQSLLKADKFELVLQKGTEIGVRRFVPITTERTIMRKADGIGDRKLERWQRIVTEAAEQSRRGLVPEIEQPQTLTAALATAERPSFLLWEGERSRRLHEALSEVPQAASIGLFIGPEGGFSSAEADLAASHGIPAVGLGPRILRAETAGLVAATIALSSSGDIG